MVTKSKLAKMSSASVSHIGQMIEAEMDNRNRRTTKFAKARKAVEDAVKSHGMTLADISDLFKKTRAKRGTSPSALAKAAGKKPARKLTSSERSAAMKRAWARRRAAAAQ